MGVAGFLESVKSDPTLRDRIAYLREDPPREARFGVPRRPVGAAQAALLSHVGIDRLWVHQARALDLLREGRDVLLTTGPSSGKTLCYVLPLLELIEEEPGACALCLHPTKALSRDQHRVIREALEGAGSDPTLAAVYDGDTPGTFRKKLRDDAAVLLTNPDMLHASILPNHSRFARILSRLRLLVIDEIHTLSGIFGTNVAHLMRRLLRVCAHYGSRPAIIACSATIGNPDELARELTGREFAVLSEDGSPRGRRTWVFWNPPRVRGTRRRARRSANVEAADVYAALLRRGVRTIVFSKARVTAELIHRYAAETAPELAGGISVYRGGYLADERREIERRLFAGELLGVSTTRALEAGIDVGGLDAAIVTGYPGNLASFFQQTGRAGRRLGDSLAVLVALDTATNQFVLRHPGYVFDRPMERGVIDRENPYVLSGHLRCAAHELPIDESFADGLGAFARVALGVLEENRKIRRIEGRWYHASSETPQHEISLRDATDRNVAVENADTGKLLGEVSKFDAPAVVHPGAVYLHHGDTYLVLDLDLEKWVATAKRAEVDYYTQAYGGDDVHHIDHALRNKPFGTAGAFFGEVTAHYRIDVYERIRFFTLDAVSRHPLHLPTWPVETMAFWVVPPEALLSGMRREGLDPMGGLRGIGFAVRTHMPLFITCDTMDLSHSVGCVNSPWQAVFVWEHYPRGLGFTEKGYEALHHLLPEVRDSIRACECGDGCPLCVGKPLHPCTVLNPERGEGSIPSRRAALRILDGILGDGTDLHRPDAETVTDSPEARRIRLERSLRRRLERMREPDVLRPAPHPSDLGWPAPEPAGESGTPDAEKRGERRRKFHRRLRNRLLTSRRDEHGRP